MNWPLLCLLCNDETRSSLLSQETGIIHVRHIILSPNMIELQQQSLMVPERDDTGGSQSQQLAVATWSLCVSGGLLGFKALKISGEREAWFRSA